MYYNTKVHLAISSKAFKADSYVHSESVTCGNLYRSMSLRWERQKTKSGDHYRHHPGHRDRCVHWCGPRSFLPVHTLSPRRRWTKPRRRPSNPPDTRLDIDALQRYSYHPRHSPPQDRYLMENITIKEIGTKAPFNGGFAFAWLNTDLCPPSQLRFMHAWGQQSNAQEQKRCMHSHNSLVCQ